MQKGSETAFLKKRKGFIRIAMQNGSAVVPCFAFGQSGTYSWCRPGPPLVSDAFVQALSRKMGEQMLLKASLLCICWSACRFGQCSTAALASAVYQLLSRLIFALSRS